MINQSKVNITACVLKAIKEVNTIASIFKKLQNICDTKITNQKLRAAIIEVIKHHKLGCEFELKKTNEHFSTQLKQMKKEIESLKRCPSTKTPDKGTRSRKPRAEFKRTDQLLPARMSLCKGSAILLMENS